MTMAELTPQNSDAQGPAGQGSPVSNLSPRHLAARFRRAKERRAGWEQHWRECYEFALPQREPDPQAPAAGAKRTNRLFDGTAPDAVDQLAASLLAQLTPPWSRWFGLAVGTELERETDAAERQALAADLDRAAAIVQSHFDRSNLAVELHQCYLDLVTAGSACLLFEEARTGEPSAFRFTAVPLTQVAFEDTGSGRLDATFRASAMTAAQIRARFPNAPLPPSLRREGRGDGTTVAEGEEPTVEVIEAVVPDRSGYLYVAFTGPEGPADGDGVELARGRFGQSPFINFRWSKAPGEVYGRSPVMKALPDIKTANKVVELVLKNATIAVTGIWQADDDGVLNPANVKLTPGTIIPKAVGSAGLTPLETPGRFDISELVLEQLRARIRSALLVDHLGQISGPRMTATEVLERSAEMARILGATYGRLQSELLTPLVKRSLALLARRGEVPEIPVDGLFVDLQYKSPLAQQHAQREAQGTRLWLESLLPLGPEALAVVDAPAVARWMAKAYGVPGELVRGEGEGGPAGPDPAAHDPAGLDPAGLDPAALDPSALAGLDPAMLGQVLGGALGGSEPAAAAPVPVGAPQPPLEP
ncbi:MAG: head-tail connector protein [Hyphomicrobiales bacterium]|nr:head-tail connector protein [Hyphomicrobiales bacterium]MCP5372337.1 head-tail connector protein [Hyphomicrobiales bacterium]